MNDTENTSAPDDEGAPGKTAQANATSTPVKKLENSPVPARSGVAVLQDIMSANWIMTLLAIVFALLVGAILIAATNDEVQTTAGYLFARPGDFFGAVWTTVSEAYTALFRGAIFDFEGDTAAAAIRPITETMTVATPLIFAGLGLAVAFRAGVFNIGAQGQVILGATVSCYLGFAFHLPVGLHLVVCLVGGIIGGAVWAGIAGVLKATTGAHEVIVTIMLNYVAIYLLQYLLRQPYFQRPGVNQPKSPVIDDSAQLPLIFILRYLLKSKIKLYNTFFYS